MARRSEKTIREQIEKLHENTRYYANTDFAYNEPSDIKYREDIIERNGIRIGTLQWVLKEKDLSE